MDRPNASASPRVVHVTKYALGRRQHPAMWRQVMGLAAHCRGVALVGTFPGYYPDSHPDDATDLASAGIHVVRHEEEFPTIADPAVAESLARRLRECHGGVDALIGHLNSAAWAVPLAQRLGVPMLATFHGNDANFEFVDDVHGPGYAQLRVAPAARFLAVSRNLANRLLEHGSPPERTFVHHLGLDLRDFPAPPRTPRRRAGLRIVMVGSFRRQKGHEIALRGFARFLPGFPDSSLHFIGLGNVERHFRLRDQIAALAAEMGVGDKVTFHGAVPAEEIPRHLALADVALQTSVFVPDDRQVEGVPNSVLEAMAARLPIVASRHGGIPEAVDHGHTGLLVEEHDVGGVARSLAELASDPALRQRMGAAGRRRVEQSFDAERQCERLAAHVRAMVTDFAASHPAARRRSRQP